MNSNSPPTKQIANSFTNLSHSPPLWLSFLGWKENLERLSKYIHEEQPYSKKDIYVTLDDMHKYQNNIVTETESEEQSKIEFEKNYQNLLNCRNI